MWEQDHLKLWDAIRAMEVRLASHEAGCTVLNTEVTRRQEESIRDRHALNLKTDGLRADFNAYQLNNLKTQNRLLIAMIGSIGSVVVGGISAAMTILK